jgi:predicted nucleotidyltransferase
MSNDQIVQILQENRAVLRQAGLKSLVWIGAASPEASQSSALEFLAELDPPPSYQHFLEVRRCLAELLHRPVDVTLVNPADHAVQPFLDPGAVFIL